MAEDTQSSFDEHLRELMEMDAAGDLEEAFPETPDDSTISAATPGEAASTQIEQTKSPAIADKHRFHVHTTLYHHLG